MNTDYIEGLSLSNIGVTIDNITIKPPSLKKILKTGEEKYNFFLTILIMDFKELLNEQGCEFSQEEIGLINSMTKFDFFKMSIFENESFKKDIIDSLAFFLCEENENIDILKYGDELIFHIGKLEEEKLITSVNFDEILKIIIIQNNVKPPEEKEFNPADAKASRLIQMMKERQRKLNAIKSKEQIKIHELASILSSNSNNINIANVWDLNIYQLNDQVARLQINENYKIQKYLLGNPYAGESIDFEKNTYMKKIKDDKKL